MDEVMTIRHLVLARGESRRAVATRLGVSRNTVKRYVAGAEVGVRRRSPRSKPKLERVQARIDVLLAESRRWTAGKQRLTATQLWRMLRAEGHQVGASLVKDYVREWKRQRAEVFVPLVYRPGELGEVDFFEVIVVIAGVRVKAWMFLMRGMASGRDFAWLFPRQDQTCFLEGHVRAFEHLGGVYQRIAYDNLKPAVAKVLAAGDALRLLPGAKVQLDSKGGDVLTLRLAAPKRRPTGRSEVGDDTGRRMNAFTGAEDR